MHKRGSRGYVLLNDNPTKCNTQTEENETDAYLDAQTASIYFHDTEERKFQRGDKILLQDSDIHTLESKMKNREIRSAVRKKRIEDKLDFKKKLVDFKSKRYLENYNKRSREWKKHESRSSQALKRTKSQNIHSAIDNYRGKREERDLAEKIAPMAEKYGENRLWKMNLRRKEQVESRMFKLNRGHLVENN